MKWIDAIRGRVSRGTATVMAQEPLILDVPALAPRIVPNQSEMPRFRTLATDRRPVDEIERLRARVRDVFIPSQPVTSRAMFAGRLSTLAHLIETVEDQRAHVVLFGERGIGKTSLLRVFGQIAREADYLVVQGTCGADTEFVELFKGLLAGIPLLYNVDLPPNQAASEGGATFASLLPEQPSPAQFSQILSQTAGTRVLILVDEFDRVEDPRFQLNVAELMKNLSDSSARVQLVIAGVSDNLRDLIGHAPSIRRNVVGLPVERMSKGEIAAIIELGERHSGITFADQAKRRIVDVARGMPYLTRILCHHASMRALNDGRREVVSDDLAPALAQAESEMGERLHRNVRFGLKFWLANDLNVLLAMAEAALDNGGPFPMTEIGGADDRAAQAVVNGLIHNGLMAKATVNGEELLSFTDDSIPLYLLVVGAKGNFKNAGGASDEAIAPTHPASG